MALTDREHPSFLHAIGLAARRIVLNPLIMSAVLGARCSLPYSVADRSRPNPAVPAERCGAAALFVLGVTVALRPFDRVPWEVPA
jgi:hypothetical protein